MNDTSTSISADVEKLEDWDSIARGDTLVYVTDHQLIVGEVVDRGATMARLSTGHDVLVSDVQRGWVRRVASTPEPWTLIPEGRESAAVLRVNGVVGTWFREGGEVGVRVITAPASVITAASVKEFWACRDAQVTSVERVQVVPEGARVLSEDEVAVPRELVERAKIAASVWGDDGDPTSVVGVTRDLAAVEGGGER